MLESGSMRQQEGRVSAKGTGDRGSNTDAERVSGSRQAVSTLIQERVGGRGGVSSNFIDLGVRNSEKRFASGRSANQTPVVQSLCSSNSLIHENLRS
jgi:hypothetical protein